MTGFAGGVVEGDRLEQMIDALQHEEWYTSEWFEAGTFGLGAQHHGEMDPQGHAFWTDAKAAGAIDGTISNLPELGWDIPKVFERFRRAPGPTLESLEGSFNIVYVDAEEERVLLGMDKIGCRPCFYTTEHRFMFGSELSALLEVIDDPVVDEQGVSDLLLMGNMWSDTTLLEEIKALRPATILEYRDDTIVEHRYWQPQYDPAPPTDEYMYRLTNSFQRAMDRAARSMTGNVGLWLSGGLDSRITLSGLAENYRDGTEFDSLVAYTYDANPGGGINPRIATEVAETLELPIETVPLNCDQFLPVLEKAIDITDGMVRWNTLLNLTAVFNIEQYRPDILMEGLFGIGHHLCRHHLTDPSSLVESMYRSEAELTADKVEDLLDVSVDPHGSFRREARRVDESSFEREVLDIHFQNYFARNAHANNHLARSQAGTRVPYADGEFLTHLANLPLPYRMGSLPVSDDTLINGVTRPKLEMIRVLNSELAEIPYERSRLKPTRPFPLHVAGFYLATALSRLKATHTYGGQSMAGEWYRSHDEFRQTLDELLDAACDRQFFDADAVRRVQERHLRGEADEINALSSITTLELWLQRNLD
jgi:asparagine synthase (glutamine-hydrolysing)